MLQNLKNKEKKQRMKFGKEEIKNHVKKISSIFFNCSTGDNISFKTNLINY